MGSIIGKSEIHYCPRCSTPVSHVFNGVFECDACLLWFSVNRVYRGDVRKRMHVVDEMADKVCESLKPKPVQDREW